MTAIGRKNRSKYTPTYNYSQCDNWSMSGEEADAILEEANSRLEAGDEDEFYMVAKKLPLPPNMALRMRDEIGKEEMLKSGFNFADAEIVFGKDWIDNYMVDEVE